MIFFSYDLKADQERVKNLLRETITMLCKNGLHFKSEFCIEGLIGVTLDHEEVFLVNLKESYQAIQTDKVALDNESICEDLSMQAVRNVIGDEVRHAGDSVSRVCVNDGDQQSVQQPRISIKNVRNKENVLITRWMGSSTDWRAPCIETGARGRTRLRLLIHFKTSLPFKSVLR